MKILITGGSGFLGQYLNLELSKNHEILTLYNQSSRNCKDFNSLQSDIRDAEKLNQIFNSFKPNVVVHTAAISTPQKADSMHHKAVYEINVTATENLAKLCKQYESKLIYTSTDLVYAGYRGSLLKEDAKLIPISLYAETKLMGEEKIKFVFDDYIILRTALMFGFGLNDALCFFHQMFENLKAGKNVKLFYDQFRSPLSALEAARIINFLCESSIKKEIINFGGSERLSRYDLGLLLCEITELDKKLIDRTSIYDNPDFPHIADVSMNVDKLKSFGINLYSVYDALLEIMK